MWIHMRLVRCIAIATTLTLVATAIAAQETLTDGTKPFAPV